MLSLLKVLCGIFFYLFIILIILFIYWRWKKIECMKHDLIVQSNTHKWPTIKKDKGLIFWYLPLNEREKGKNFDWLEGKVNESCQSIYIIENEEISKEHVRFIFL